MRKFIPKMFYIQQDERIFSFSKKMEAILFFQKIDFPQKKVEWLGFWDGEKFLDKKTPALIVGNYYFEVQTEDYPVLIGRHSEEEAFSTFSMYSKMCSSNCTWLGIWNGNKFIQNQPSEAC